MEKEYVIDASSFEFANQGKEIHDQRFDTKPVGYMKDALRRFAKNKGSVVAACVILILILFALITPLASPYTVAFRDPYYKTTLPITQAAIDNQNIDFWDGCSEKEFSKIKFEQYYGINIETGQPAVKRGEYTTREEVKGNKRNPKIFTYYTIRLNSYYQLGNMYMTLDIDVYNAIQAYQDATGRQVLYPVVNPKERVSAILPEDKALAYTNEDGYFWYKIKVSDSYEPLADLDENGNYQNNYAVDPTSNKDGYFSSVLVEGEDKQYLYAIKKDGDIYEVRVNYYEYFCFVHSAEGDPVTTPFFAFGTNGDGQDILTCLAEGAKFSFLLALIVSAFNLIVGAIYGAIEGYYGGAVDIFMERISDILAGIPMMIVLTLVRLQLSDKTDISSSTLPIVSLLISFFATGWIGSAGSVRMQFYRYKHQEYILAARTLGAKDKRIMFRHIFPNAIGTLITGSVLSIPGVMFSESSLSYLGILDMSSTTSTSIGTMLANGQPFFNTFPHVLIFPAVFISLLMLSFNLFGNGLRDAFNPSLRGSEG